jgi:ABC-type nitrate/sulfonate/bicarbonate transport system substrate-binding protein
LLFSCQEQIGNGDKIPVKIAVSKTPLSAPFFIAKEMRYFEESCVKVTLDKTIGGKLSFEKVVTGQADFGTSSDSVIAFKSLSRSDFSTLTTFVQSDNDVKIITLDKSNIHTSKDLVGKRIGLVEGSAGEYLLSTYLAIGGGDINDVDIQNIAPDKLQQALLDNHVEAIVSWEPYAYQSINNSKFKTKQLNTKNIYTLSFNLISQKIRTQSQLKSAECVINALHKAINYIAAKPTKSQKILIKHLELDQGFINWLWPDYIFKLSLNRTLMMSLESQANWAIKTGMVQPRAIPDYHKIMDSRALEKIDNNAITIK